MPGFDRTGMFEHLIRGPWLAPFAIDGSDKCSATAHIRFCIFLAIRSDIGPAYLAALMNSATVYIYCYVPGNHWRFLYRLAKSG